jgi:hypothetical protein
MNRRQFEHVLRAVSTIAEDPDVLVIGSQSILGSYSEDELPIEATGSMEVDAAFFDDPEETKSGVVDVMIGELSNFHNEFGYYPQVSVSPQESSLKVGGIGWLCMRHLPRGQAEGCALNHMTAFWASL